MATAGSSRDVQAWCVAIGALTALDGWGTIFVNGSGWTRTATVVRAWRPKLKRTAAARNPVRRSVERTRAQEGASRESAVKDARMLASRVLALDGEA
jgi:phage tail tape-measure protein